MDSLLSGLLGLLPWAWGALVLAPIAWLLRGWRRRRCEVKNKAKHLRLMCQLHPDEKAVLFQFVQAQSDTVVLNPSEPAVEQLHRFSGFLERGAGVGPYRAVACYFTLRPAFYDLLPAWLAIDPWAIEPMREALEEPPDTAGLGH